MPRMTKKEVRQFIDNPENWKVIDGNRYVRAALLDIGPLHYIKIEQRCITNHSEMFLHNADPETGFSSISYSNYDPDLECVLYSTSRTEMENRIYEECRKENGGS